MEEFLTLLAKYTDSYENGEYGLAEYIDNLTAILPDKELAVRVNKILKGQVKDE